MNANPNAQNRRPHRNVSTMHSVRTFTVSRDRAKPASSAMNPACMKKTRNAVTSTQTVLTGFTRSFAWCVTSCADAGVSISPTIWLIANSTAITPSILPAKIVRISFRVRPSARRRRSVFTIVPSLFHVPSARSMAPGCALR